jgi:hypothetical protein
VRPIKRAPLVIFAAALALGGAGASAAFAEESDGGASWRLEQPLPPELPSGHKSDIPVGLGRIGDIEFWAPNRGLLITAGNPPTIPPGVWSYNGVAWHELATVCGASDGRIAWAAPDEFWTVSDGRPGQVAIEAKPPLEDNTLCHFSGGEVVTSYASLAFRADSYQAMHAAGCVAPNDCWFAGDPLPEGQTGAFHLHWDGHSLSAEANPQGHATEDMRSFEGELFESVRILGGDLLGEPESASEPSDLHVIEPDGVQPRFLSLLPGVPIYSEAEFPQALDFPHLSSDSTAMWGAADPAATPAGSTPAEVTVLRMPAGGALRQIVGPTTDPEGANPFTKEPGVEGVSSRNEFVNGIAAEPPGDGEGEGTAAGESAWLALDSNANAGTEPFATARVARISEAGEVSEAQTLPSEAERSAGVGPKGSAVKIACPAPHDCWLATAQGWLYHLVTDAGRGAELGAPNTDPVFNRAQPITFRPPDAGIPALVPDAPPVDDSGLLGEAPLTGPANEVKAVTEPRVTLPLFSHLRSRVRGRTLELKFHLAVKARVRLVAKRRRRVVASTHMRTLPAGNRVLLLALSRRSWPTSLALQSHALAPLPTISTKGSNVTAFETGLKVLPRSSFPSGLGPVG